MKCIRKEECNLCNQSHKRFTSLNVDARKKVIHAFVLPHIRYRLPVWDNANTGSYNQMNFALERTIRIILNDRKATFDN